ncbi:MAG: hypothetical protein PHN42_05795 [Bacilli bacterium]|nr:hypothetical protein [Bacilli bacterium]
MKFLEKKILIKTLIIFAIYFSYTVIVSSLLGVFNLNDQIYNLFIADLIFFFGMICAYKNKIKDDYHEFLNKYKLKEKILIIFKWVLLLFIFNLIMGFLTEIFLPSAADGIDDNVNALKSLFGVSTMYTIFKAMLFAPIVEELLFRESISECINNKIVFMITTSLIYAIMNTIYGDMSKTYMILDFISYFLFYLILSGLYLKYNKNIVIIMFIKFFYNLIPLTILLLGV